MAEKELRIAIYETDKQVVEGNYGDFYDTISRKNSIEKIAKGIHRYEWGFNNMPKWEELNEDIQNDYKNMAESALNALLGVEK